jgi:hypothetical protein
MTRIKFYKWRNNVYSIRNVIFPSYTNAFKMCSFLKDLVHFVKLKWFPVAEI